MTQGDAQNDPLIGQVIAGKFHVIRLLGEGGMGCVFLAEQKLGTTSRKVAVKTLHRHLSQDPQIKKRFEREVSTVVALEHPNTIQVFDYGEMPDGQLYIVMEYVQGQSVADILEKEGPMPPERVERILSQVCGSLEEAHGHQIVHRDLKPDNVVLTERAGQKDWVEVLDFGIAKRSTETDPNEAKLTQQGMVLGTPPYMSPEQFTGVPIDARSDIYSLGVMAYEMLTGKLPFDANTAWEWASKHMTEPPLDIHNMPNGMNVPDKARDAIMRALAKNRDDRFATVRDFFEAFASGGGAQPTTGAMVASGAGGPNSGAGAPTSRARTEMAQPVMGGGPPEGVPPPGMGGPPPGAPPPGMGAPGPIPVAAAPAAVPRATPAAAPKKGGAGALIAVAGVVAVITIVGVVVLVMKRNTKTPVATVPTMETATTATTTSASVAHKDEPPPEIKTAEPLTPPPAVANNTPPSTKPAGKTPTKPPPTKPPPVKPKVDPPICASYRAAKAGGQSAAIVGALAAKCRAAGGTP